MAYLLLINLIFFLSISTNYAFELIPICKEDRFNYSDIEVNSIFKLKYNRTFKQVRDYIIETNINYYDYFASENARKLENNRDMYNEQFLEIFNDRYINNPEKLSKIAFTDIFSEWKTAMSLAAICKDEHREKFYNNTVLKMKNGYYFANTLKSLYFNKFDQVNRTFVEIEDILLSLEAENGKTVALQYESIDKIYKYHEILLLDKFILNKSNKLFFYPRYSGTLLMEIVLPFNDVNYQENIEDCVTASNLPRFYRKSELSNNLERNLTKKVKNNPTNTLNSPINTFNNPTNTFNSPINTFNNPIGRSNKIDKSNTIKKYPFDKKTPESKLDSW